MRLWRERREVIGGVRVRRLDWWGEAPERPERLRKLAGLPPPKHEPCPNARRAVAHG